MLAARADKHSHFNTVAIFSAITLLEGKDWSGIKEEIKIKFLPVYKVESVNSSMCVISIILFHSTNSPLLLNVTCRDVVNGHKFK